MLIEKLYEIVENRCKGEGNKFGYGIWKHHMIPVVEFSKKLAEKTGADIEIVTIAALLHDIASVTEYKYYEDHHEWGAKFSEEILRELGCDEEKIKHVSECVYAHRSTRRKLHKSEESICVANADAMAHIDNFYSILHLAYVEKGMGIDEGKVWAVSKINRSWDKLSHVAREMMKDKYEAIQLLFGDNK